MIFVDPEFDSHKKLFDDITIDELLDKQHSDLCARIESQKHEGLGWQYHLMLQCQ